MTRRLGLLGPQRFDPTLADAVKALGLEGSLATVTAGWQERESEVDELNEHLAGRAVNLALHRRADSVFARDPELAQAHKERQALFRRLQELYVFRLHSLKRVCRELFSRPGDDPALASERGDAIDALRRLDARHLSRLTEIHAAWNERHRPFERDAVAAERREIASLLDGTAGLAIAGGHVAVLLNRLRLFGVLELLGERPVVAWSGGAMVCAERIVLFHDRPPQGRGNAEVLDRGLGVAPGLVLLPHARRRLDLDDPVRLQILALRFAPARCVTLDDRACLLFDGQRWSSDPGVAVLSNEGVIEPLSGSAA
ncbi:MAG: hypothetical protein ABIP29_04595 [Candidatus Eisenbacteria bacterium]